MQPNPMHPETDDRDLLRQVGSGDQKAFAVLFDRHWKRLYYAALHVIDDRDVAEDIVQDCFISLWEKGAHKAIDNVEAYLYQSVKYKCFMHLRSGAISKKHLDRITTLSAAHNSTEEAIDERELQEVLNHSMATLPEKCRQIFYLSRFESLPNKKIAEQLHISPKTVENQITKALRILRLSVDKMISVILVLLLS
jgi:RNA polymerase sigma-70 factor (ECF subfamily)